MDVVDTKIASTLKTLQRLHPRVGSVSAAAVQADATLHATSERLRDVQKLRQQQRGATDHAYSAIAEVAREQRLGSDPRKVGTTLCFSCIMQRDIDSGQAQRVSRLYRRMCDKYVQFGEGDLLVPTMSSASEGKDDVGDGGEDADDDAYVLGEHVIALQLEQPSSHAENWEKLNAALSYVVEHFFDYDFYLKVRVARTHALDVGSFQAQSKEFIFGRGRLVQLASLCGVQLGRRVYCGTQCGGCCRLDEAVWCECL